MNTHIAFYKNQLEKHTQALQHIKRQLAISSSTRLLLFISAIGIIYAGYPSTKIIIGTILVSIALFLILIRRHSNLVYAKKKMLQLIAINKQEIAVANGAYDALDTGSEFIDPTHFYSHDIDLFGERSFFQYSNRTTTLAGKQALANILTSNDISNIPQKQEAIKALAAMPEWRQEFSAIAALVKTSIPILQIEKWLHQYTPSIPSIFKTLPTIFSGISVVFVILLFTTMIPFSVFLIWFFIGLGIIGTQLKKINTIYHQAHKVKDTFEQYYKLVAQIEQLEFTAPLLKEKQQQLLANNSKASTALAAFARILDAFDQRNNMMYGIFGNGLLLWDLIQSYRAEQWIITHRGAVTQWFETIAFFDAYNSLGNFAFNHDKYTYPIIATAKDTVIDATDLGHPMLDPTKCVTNTIRIDQQDFFIITGANMAGKSTFLRTVALQMVMSNIGLPVCATKCTYSPTKLITSMRTSDSLSDDASYFFSELTQLKKIVNALVDENYFIILDEILKGTNSKDKAEGSRKFVEKLVTAQATGIIATHDLSLCEIASVVPQVHNKFFDAQIVDDELYFDYTFKNGICQNMNASFLLNKMGIV